MFHVKQDASQFLYFANTLLETKYEFEQVRYVGGDRSQSQKAFLKPLKGAKFLPGKNMSSLGIELGEQGNILKEVLKMETKGFKCSRLCGIPNSGTILSPMLLMT